MKSFLLVYLVLLIYRTCSSHQPHSGCLHGSPAVRLVNDTVQACPGSWTGHIRNSSNLCSPGWHVCSWMDSHILKRITWKDAINTTGCYAYNAAQDGATCKECSDNLESDDLAGLGRGCPHQMPGQKACIQGGQISASCCVDSHFKKACIYKPGVASGVLCCKKPGRAPKMVFRGAEKVLIQARRTLVLPCDVVGEPVPEVTWYKDGGKIEAREHQISILKSGRLLINAVSHHHSGNYKCVASNNVGRLEVITMVTVTDRSLGCSDRSTEGLRTFPNIRACKGSWEGHIQHANKLCAAGWHVCDIDDLPAIQTVVHSQMDGCYVLDVTTKGGAGCQGCRKHSTTMAALGESCPRRDQSASFSCLKDVITEIRRARHHGSCSYVRGVTSGVMCCKHHVSESSSSVSPPMHPILISPICSPPCQNGGRCGGYNRCKCLSNYSGTRCQTPVCNTKCRLSKQCWPRGLCRGRHSRMRKCQRVCLNGGRCKHGRCKCSKWNRGEACQHFLKRL